MRDPIEALILDLLEWIGPQPKSYRHVMAAWRTSCPRLAVWEEATARGLVAHLQGPGERDDVAVTPGGFSYLSTHRCAVLQ